ncbi:MAG: hypothetical protein ABIZ80_04050, partial [Bryobacteraceae bacterium]
NFCDKRIATQDLTITDPGGGATGFTLSVNIPGVTISPSSGVTPATVRISVDPNQFQNRGTVTGQLTVSSESAVNVVSPIRVLVNNREPDQRGTVVNVPGQLNDIVSDPVRDRFYILRKDKNQVLVFDGARFTQIGTMRTGNSPTQMAITRDGKYLLVAQDLSWNANVYDLDTLEAQAPIEFPFAHYPSSIAVSGSTILAAADNRQVGKGYTTIDRVDLESRTAIELPSLGPFENKFTSYVTMSGNPNGSTIFGAVGDGGVFLYNSSSDTFPVYRKDLPGLKGAFAASGNGEYLVDNYLLNASLVRVGTLDAGAGQSSGFVFTTDGAFRTTTAGDSAAGVIQRVNLSSKQAMTPTKVIEAPLAPRPATGFTSLPNPFTRTLAVLRNGLVSLTQSGFTVLPLNYESAAPPPSISRVVNTADPTAPVTSGGLISVFGTNLSLVTLSSQDPLPGLVDACVTVNGGAIPIFLISPGQINAQLPFSLVGPSEIIVRTPGGSATATFTTLPNAPAIFHDQMAGGETGLPFIVRVANNTLMTLANPIHKGDDLIIYLTGLGRTIPAVEAGQRAPSDPRAAAILQPVVTLDGVELAVSFAGLTPGRIGVYQIDVHVPKGVTQGLSVPLRITQGTRFVELGVRVVE